MGNFLKGRYRTCNTTGLPVCLDAQFFIKAHAVAAVVFFLIGAIAALLIALTRWSAVHLLPAMCHFVFCRHQFAEQPPVFP